MFNRLSLGFLLGAFIGAAEAVITLARDPWWMFHAAVIPAAIFLYGLLGAAVALLAGRRLPLGVAASAALYLVVAFQLAQPYLPDVSNWACLSRLLIWTLIWAAAAWLLRKRPVSAWKAPLIAFLLLACMAGLAAPRLGPAGREEGPAAGELPNVLLVVMDTARADHFSCYGYGRPTTPNVDRLAREGTLFEHAVTTAPWTLPSHASLFTGLYTSQHGCDRDSPRLNEALLTAAELLDAHGYQTAGFSNNPWVGPDTNFHQGFDFFEGKWKGSGPLFKLSLIWVATRVKDRIGWKDTHSAEAAATNESVRGWLDNVRRERVPFFLFINYIDVHSPYRPREPFRSRFLRDENRTAAADFKQAELNRIAPPVTLDPAVQGALVDLYDAEIAALDSEVGTLISLLEQRGLLDKTLVIITSDHGEGLGEHRHLGHRFNVYEPVLRIPLVLRLPGRYDGGARVEEPVSLVDVFPTLAALLSIEQETLPSGLAGRLLPAEKGTEPAPRWLLSEYTAPVSWIAKFRKHNSALDESYFRRNLKAARYGSMKFIWASDGRHELYDLAADPAEQTDMAAQQPETAVRLKEEAEHFIAGLKPVAGSQGPQLMDENVRRQLRALGYVQ